MAASKVGSPTQRNADRRIERPEVDPGRRVTDGGGGSAGRVDEASGKLDINITGWD